MLPLASLVECPAIVRFAEPAPIAAIGIEANPEPGCLGRQVTSLVQLDFSELPAFSTVYNQYQGWGVAIESAMAIRPSNPAFVNAKYRAGLMPASRQPLTIRFQQARQLIGLELASAQQIMLRAYDASNQLVAEQQVGQTHYRQSNHQSGEAAATCTHHQVQLAAKAITRVEICADAPFLLHGLLCG